MVKPRFYFNRSGERRLEMNAEVFKPAQSGEEEVQDLLKDFKSRFSAAVNIEETRRKVANAYYIPLEVDKEVRKLRLKEAKRELGIKDQVRAAIGDFKEVFSHKPDLPQAPNMFFPRQKYDPLTGAVIGSEDMYLKPEDERLKTEEAMPDGKYKMGSIFKPGGIEVEKSEQKNYVLEDVLAELESVEHPFPEVVHAEKISDELELLQQFIKQ